MPVTVYNRNYCFNCGQQVDPDDWDQIGYTKVWICTRQECHRVLSQENQGAYEQKREDALQEVEMRWGGY